LIAGYQYFKTGNDYEFFTIYGAAYAVSFIPAGVYFATPHSVKDFIYRTDITQVFTGPYNYPDLLVGITVAEIVNDFFGADSRNVLFYMCDPQDGKMKARQRKFDYWYRLYNSNDYSKIISTIKQKVLQ
jgi:hypothetical protein